MARLHAPSDDAVAEPPATAPSADPAEEEEAQEEQACMELTYIDVHGERSGPAWQALGRALALAVEIDPAEFSEPLGHHTRASLREEQLAVDFRPNVARGGGWEAQMQEQVQRAMRQALGPPTRSDCREVMSLQQVRGALRHHFATEEQRQELIEPQRELLRLMQGVMPLLCTKANLRGSDSARSETELLALAVALTNHLEVVLRRQTDGGSELAEEASGAVSDEESGGTLRTTCFKPAIVEAYPDGDSRSDGSWPGTFETLSAAALRKGASAVLFARRYGAWAWTICIHFVDAAADSGGTSSARQLLFGAAVGERGVTPLPTRTAMGMSSALGLPLEQLSATSRCAPATLINLDDNHAVRFRLRSEHPVWNAAALDQVSRAHKAGATQGERLRMGSRLPGGVSEDQARRQSTMPAGELGFESGRYAQDQAFSRTQAASSMADVLASVSLRQLAPPAPYLWRDVAPPVGFTDADALRAPFALRDGIADPARDPAGPTAQLYRELLRSPVTDPAAPSSEVTSAAGAASSAAAGAAEAAAVGARTSTRGAGRRVLARRPSPTAPKRARL